MTSDHRQREIMVAEHESGERIDRLLAARTEFSRTRLKTLILDGHVAIDGGTIRDPGLRVNANQRIALALPEPESAEPLPERIPLKVLYEDDELIVIDKPSGLIVHPGSGKTSGTLVNALIAHCGTSLSGIGDVKRPGIVHRLDKDTTGVMVAAKTDRAHRSLSAQFADHGRAGALEREYLAFVWGAPERPQGVIDAPIGRHRHAREKQTVRKDGREAVTHWRLLERYPGTDGKPAASLLACRLETGRTHQIRVHLAHIGQPLLGDDVYGSGFKTKAAHLAPAARKVLETLGRQALHAYLLAIEHPNTGEALEFRSELPGDLARLKAALAAPAKAAANVKKRK